MGKNKILILGKLPPPYFGPAVATEIILNSKLKEDFDIEHFDTRINYDIKAIGEKKINKFFLVFKNYKNYLEKLRKTRPELILIPISQSTLGFIKDSVYIFSGSRLRIKILLHLRGSNLLNWLNSSSLFTRKFFRYILNLTSGGIVLGESLKYLLNDYFRPEQIHVVPNGGNFNYSSVKKSYNKLKILCLSNMIQSKGIEDVIDAAAIVDRNVRNSVTFILAGEWLNEKFKKHSLEKILTGNLPVVIYSKITPEQKIELLSEANVFVFTPREPEGHPWVIIEAMAASLPVISTNQGAIAESVIDGINGFIVDSKSPYQIAEKIKFFVDNPDLLIKMGNESFRIYKEKYTEEVMVNNLKLAIEKTLQ